jgi:hypothetical protein
MKEIYVLKNYKYSKLLLYSSHLFLINSYLAYNYNIIEYCYISLFIYLNSINYWRKPTMSLRRNIDIVTSIISFMYHKYIILYNSNILSIILLYIGILFYILGLIVSKKNIFLSVIFHILLHLFTNLSCLFFYINI